MRRFYRYMLHHTQRHRRFIHSFSDTAGDVTGAVGMHVTVGLELLHKSSAYQMWRAAPVAMWGTAKFLFQVLRYRYNFVVAFGPGFFMAIAVIVKIYGCRLIHVETWLQFDSKSITGRVPHPFADGYLVQNAELLNVYGPKAEYAGGV